MQSELYKDTTGFENSKNGNDKKFLDKYMQVWTNSADQDQRLLLEEQFNQDLHSLLVYLHLLETLLHDRTS